MTEEEWRPVVGFEELYEVSSVGNVRRIGRAARTGKGRGGGVVLGRVLRGGYTPNGYRVVQLWRGGNYFSRLVHRLVAEAFIGVIPTGLTVNHKNGVKTDNAVANLEVVTSSENNRHAYAMGLRKPVSVPNRRKKQRLTIACACGCGTELVTPDPKGRDRRFVTGHNMRREAA